MQGRNGEADIENRHIGREEERVRCSERVTWKLTLPCKRDSEQEFAVCLRELKQKLCINLKWWDGEGGVRGVQEGGNICIPMADSC